jgi:hypothetical protein
LNLIQPLAIVNSPITRSRLWLEAACVRISCKWAAVPLRRGLKPTITYFDKLLREHTNIAAVA